MEYMNGGSLDLVLKKMGKIPEKFSRKITYAVSIQQIQSYPGFGYSLIGAPFIVLAAIHSYVVDCSGLIGFSFFFALLPTH